jgi:hypothetical protein
LSKKQKAKSYCSGEGSEGEDEQDEQAQNKRSLTKDH